MTEMKFFVYGSMSEGFVHFSKIKDFIADSTPAQIKAQAFRLKVGFPVVLEGGEDFIPGQVVTLKATSAPELLLSLLDEFHGHSRLDESKSIHQRKEIQAQTAEGEITSWCYFLEASKLPKGAQKIQGGNWVESLKSEPLLTEKLSERQKAYILKLGATSGREIVPIDLGLYRELMNLEMIVDKGRRLALSKLGHEVFRYLT